MFGQWLTSINTIQETGTGKVRVGRQPSQPWYPSSWANRNADCGQLIAGVTGDVATDFDLAELLGLRSSLPDPMGFFSTLSCDESSWSGAVSFESLRKGGFQGGQI